MYKAVAFKIGYVESNSTSWVIYQTKKQFALKKETLFSLVEYFYSKFSFTKNEQKSYNDKNKLHMANCCRKAWSNRIFNNPPKSCPKCNADYSVELEYEFDYEEWTDFIRDIFNSDCDSYGEHDESQGWSPWEFEFDVPKEQMIIIYENAEHVFSCILGMIRQDLKDVIDEECSEYIFDDTMKLIEE